MERAGITSIYAFISAATVWPVVEAARAGDWGALAALGTVLAGLGSNLLANRIQNWRDEVDAAKDIESCANQEPQLRAELDAVLENLQALELAESTVPATEKEWFVTTLQQELQRLGNFRKFAAKLRGSGAIAQGEKSTALGEQARLVTGKVKGDVVERLAYEAHNTGKDKKEAADLSRGTGLTLLEAPQYPGNTALAAEFLEKARVWEEGCALRAPKIFLKKHKLLYIIKIHRF